jgi:hypothetical protein
MFVSTKKMVLLLLILILPIGQAMAIAISSVETAPLASSGSFAHHHDVSQNSTIDPVDCDDNEHCEVHCHASLVFHLDVSNRFNLSSFSDDHPQFRLGFFIKRTSPPLLEPPII